MTTYYKKLVNGNEALFNNIKVREDSIPICLERLNKNPNEDPYKFFAEFRSSYQLLKEIADTPVMERCFFEIIRGNHAQKHYIDIDIHLSDDDFSEAFPHSIEEKINISEVICSEYITALLKLKPEINTNDIIIANSNSNSKRSFHIIVDRWFFPSATQNRELFLQCMELIPLPHRKYFDHSMYKSIQQFRILFSTKCGKNRFKKIDKNSTWKYSEDLDSDEKKLRELFYASLITEVTCCNMLSFEYKNRTEFVPSRFLDNNEINVIRQHFKKFKDHSNFDFAEFKNSIIHLRRKQSSYCEVCQRNHDSQNPYLYVTFNNQLYLNCRRNDKSQFISDLTTNDEGTIITCENVETNYKIPTIGYDIKVSNFINDGVINLVDKPKESNSYPHLDELINCKEEKIKPVVIQSEKKSIVTVVEKTEHQKIIEDAKLRHKNLSNKRSSVVERLYRVHNHM